MMTQTQQTSAAARHLQPRGFAVKIARTPAEIDGFWKLRHDVFRNEQKVIQGSDRDEEDRVMIPIVRKSIVMGMEDEVVGVVRIHEREPRVWWGSRLGVRRGYRNLRDLSSSVPMRNRLPDYAARSIDAALIYKAVSTAHALGCDRFLAHVQKQNAKFFERLHWKPLHEIELHGFTHVHMEADLGHYPPATHDIPSRQVVDEPG